MNDNEKPMKAPKMKPSRAERCFTRMACVDTVVAVLLATGFALALWYVLARLVNN